MSVIGPEGLRPFRPRIIGGSHGRRFRHHFEGGHRPAAHADHRSDAVVARVAASDDDHVAVPGVKRRRQLFDSKHAPGGCR